MDDGFVESTIFIKAESPRGSMEYKHNVSVVLEPVSSIGLGEDKEPVTNSPTVRSNSGQVKRIVISSASYAGMVIGFRLSLYAVTEDSCITCPPVGELLLSHHLGEFSGGRRCFERRRRYRVQHGGFQYW